MWKSFRVGMRFVPWLSDSHRIKESMKTYIIYVDGEKVGMLKAGSHNAAEKKAQAKYPGKQVNVSYTEV